MSTSLMEWRDFLDEAPDHVIDVIENGPKPLTEYGNSKLSWSDKKLGICRFKGGTGNVPVKSGQQAIVYFDPMFAENVDTVPEHIEARHSDSEVELAFTKM